VTEAEWLAATDLVPMLQFLKGKASDRKWRLLICGCCRQLPDAYLSQEEFGSIESGEQYADGGMSLEELNRCRSNRPRQFHATGLNWYTSAIRLYALCRRKLLFQSALAQVSVTAQLRVEAAFGQYRHEHKEARRVATLAERHFIARVVRDVFGSPFCTVMLDPSWLTSTVRLLAEGIYQERAFTDRLPILADALQDAGCDDDRILNHCRSDSPHVRGCWVVDLLLGKQ
jgi:hypothetical protein